MARNRGNKEDEKVSEQTTPSGDAPEAPAGDAAPAAAPAEAPKETKEKVDPAVTAEGFKTSIAEAMSVADQSTGAIPEANLVAVVTAYKALTPSQRGVQLAERMGEVNAEALADPANVKVWMLQAAGAIQSAVAKSTSTRGGAQPREKAPAVPAFVQLATAWAALGKAGEAVVPEGISEEDTQKARDLFTTFQTTGEAEGISGDLVTNLTERLVKVATAKKKSSGGGGGGPRNSAATLDMAALNGTSFTHKSKDGERTLTVKDGKWVLDDGTEFTSPTAAAKIVMGPTKDGKDPSVNGRRFWNIPA